MVADKTAVLIVEDDQNIVDLVRSNLSARGHDVIVSKDGSGVSEILAERALDVVLLDLMLPGRDGFELCREIRQESGVGIIVLSARRAETDKVRALNLGADDYVTKPFDSDELIARVRALLRRRGAGAAELEVLSDEALTLDEAQRRVAVSGAEVQLTPTEFKLLATLMRNRGQVVTQEQLLEEVWGNAGGDPRQVRLYVSYLRRKLADAGIDPVETVRGFGYRFRSASSRPGSPV